MISSGAWWVVCLEDIETGRALAAKAKGLAGTNQVVCVGFGEEALPDGADAGLLLPDAGGDACAMGEMLATALAAHTPQAVLAPATTQGRAVMAWAAARLETGLTADCTALSLTEEGLLLQTRPAFGGRMIADILCRERRPQMATVRPGVFLPPEEEGPSTPATRQNMPVPGYLRRLAQTSQDTTALADARVVVAGGRGIGSREGFQRLKRLAELLGGAVAASRGAVDAGFAPYSQQVGQTGCVVRPGLYIAVGIHGAVQHTLGMDGSERVIAINQDRSAPIFMHADYGIAAPWRDAVEALIKGLEKERSI